MRAVSFLRGIAHVEYQAAAAASKHRFSRRDAEPYRRANAARDALCDVGVQFVCASPLPASNRRAATDADDAVETLLDCLYRRARIEPVGEAFERAHAAGRARADDGVVVVPLGTDPAHVSNWYTLCRSLIRYTEDAAEECVRVETRLEADGRGGAARRWAELDTLATTFGRTVVSIAAAREWVDPSETEADDAAKLVEVAERTVEYTSPGTNK